MEKNEGGQIDPLGISRVNEFRITNPAAKLINCAWPRLEKNPSFKILC